VGLVGVTGVKSRFVCVAGGVILIVLGLLPKMAALVESLPTFVLGGAGLVMFGMVAATGIRILAGVDYKTTATTCSSWPSPSAFGMIPLIAPNFKQWMPHNIHPLIESGILLASHQRCAAEPVLQRCYATKACTLPGTSLGDG
jgi:xanthine/uracil permease